MKQYFAVFCMLFSLSNGFAQENGSTKKFSLKVYNITSYEKNSDRFSESNELNFIKPSIAFQLKTQKRMYHEIELINFQVNKNHNTNKDMQTGAINHDFKKFKTDISLRYELIFPLNKSENKKWMPAIGVGINPYFIQMINTPLISTAFKTNFTHTGANLFLIPRLVYNISDRLYLDINIPVLLSENNFDISKVENPHFTKEQQTNSTFTSTLLPAFYSGRIGLGVRI